MAAAANKLAVIGVTGYIGQATVKALVAKNVEFVAGVRDPKSEKAKFLTEAKGVTAVAADMAKPAELTATLKAHNITTVYLITPGAQNRAELTVGAAKAAKEAGVKHIAFVSVATYAKKGTVFGDQIAAIEDGIKALGVNYTALRLPLFTDNLFGSMGSIKGEGKIYGPKGIDKPYSTITTGDAGEAAAVILSDVSKHVNAAYTINCKPYTEGELAKLLTTATGREVAYVQVPYDAAKQAFMGLGFPEWQVDGIMELFKLIDAGDEAVTKQTGDFKKIVGREPTTIDQFVGAVGGLFKPDAKQ